MATTISFTDISRSDYEITSWQWSFGDGGSSTEQNPSHEYASPGIYTVTLVATNVLGNSDSYSLPVIIGNNDLWSGSFDFKVAEYGFSKGVPNGPSSGPYTHNDYPDWQEGVGYRSGAVVGVLTEAGLYRAFTSLPNEMRKNITRIEAFYELESIGFWPNGAYPDDNPWEEGSSYPYGMYYKLELVGKISGNSNLVYGGKAEGYITSEGDGSVVLDINPGIYLPPNNFVAWYLRFRVQPAMRYEARFVPYIPFNLPDPLGDARIVRLDIEGFGPSALQGAYFEYTSDELDFEFTDTSIGSVSAWFWDFGDGTSSTSQNPSHSYEENGVFTVTLTVTIDGEDYEFSQDVQALGLFDWESVIDFTVDDGGFTPVTGMGDYSETVGWKPVDVLLAGPYVRGMRLSKAITTTTLVYIRAVFDYTKGEEQSPGSQDMAKISRAFPSSSLTSIISNNMPDGPTETQISWNGSLSLPGFEITIYSSYDFTNPKTASGDVTLKSVTVRGMGTKPPELP